MPPGVTAPPRRTCRRRRSGSSPPSFSSQQNASTTNRDFLRGVARLGGFLARKSDGEPGWQTIWKGWFVLMILVEGYELAQAIASPK